ncbi:PREDICTED: probable LRR receptor-like serine/threonine-protein kinase At1g14390 [Tarenaya hassleriana]|uniref:probable LRR receptor-like serine/threonine-protein kinase At1g14390 n=1 Tax=Tarenaya hassleriana TaxID=28532 RepID=UPI00053C27AD|nr:PREDICTED: probable LRR receptor-like serine/threonine-protein kinase At1g14390 [Tarenaya hassleriana]
MHNFLNSQAFSLAFLLLPLLLLPTFSESQLTSSETRSLFEIQKLLEHPESLRSWNNWTNFCFLPSSPSLRIVCSDGHVTELTILGNRTVKLSETFSSDSFFTVLTKLSSLKTLSLVSLGISGPFPSKITRLSSLQVLNFSSNFISGPIPKEIASLNGLRSLALANNLLNATVPDLRGLLDLRELNLGGNRLGPEVPSLASNLITVSLKKNSFGSKIPEQIKKMGKLQSLDLSDNKFTGPIPDFLFSLPSLQNLSLCRNLLSGSFPNLTCSSKLRTLDVSRNLLTGKLPSCFSSKRFQNHTVIYSFNCLSINGTPSAKYQRPASFCKSEAEQAVAVKPVPKEQKKDSEIKLGVLIGIIVGVVIVTSVLALLILIIMRRSRSEAEAEQSEGNNVERHAFDKVSVCSTTTSKTVPDSRRVPQTMRSAVIGLPPYRVFNLEELEEATNNFEASNLVGEQLYRGFLREGIAVTVKCIKLKQKNSPQNLAQQMEVLSKLRHMHLVSVLGHCIVTYQDHHPYAGSTIFVVQEYFSNGSLRDFLTDWRKKEVLKWPQRMAIAIGVARGIQFLHTGVAPGIFGNNLDIENILLDETLGAKICGYTIPLPHSKVGAGSPLQGNQAKSPLGNEDREKEDVYQFGVILLEIITGRVVASSSDMGGLKLQLENGLKEEPSVLRSLIDPSVRGTYAYESLRTTVEFAINCLCEDPSKRPSIEDVVWNLQYTIQVQQGWTSSGNLGIAT